MNLFGRNYMIRGSLISVLLWALLAGPSQATVYEIPADGTSVVGTDTHMTAVYQDTLLDIARRNSLGYYEIIRANPAVDMWLPGAGTDIMLPGRRILPPGPREGIVVNLPEHRLYYYPKPRAGERAVVLLHPGGPRRPVWGSPGGREGGRPHRAGDRRQPGLAFAAGTHPDRREGGASGLGPDGIDPEGTR